MVPPRWILVLVSTTDGGEGWGEAIVAKRPRAVAGAVDDLAANVIGEDANRVEELWQRMHRGAFFRGGPILSTAAAAMDMALWDLKARLVGLPVHELLGGAVREAVRGYSWVDAAEPDAVVVQAKTRLARGFDAVKLDAAGPIDWLRATPAIDAVVGRVDALRRELGPDLGIALDLHGRAPLAIARVLLRELESYGLLWVEEPVSPECDDDLAALRAAAGSVPLATGERLTSRYDFRRLLAERSVDIIQPDVALTGLFELEKICRMAEAFDVAVAPHAASGPLALAASLQVGFCCRNIVIQEVSRHLPFHDDETPGGREPPVGYLEKEGAIRPHRGRFARADWPGLGVEVDVSAVRTVSERAWQVADPVWRHDDGRVAEW